MPQDPRVKHLERLHRQRRLRAARRCSKTGAPSYGVIPQRSQLHDAGRMLLALVLLSIILGALLSLPGHGDVRTWVHQLSYSLQVDRVGMLPPPGGFGLAFLGFFAGDRARARELVAECLSLYHELGHKGGIAMLLESFAIIAAIEGAGEAAACLLGAADALREEVSRRDRGKQTLVLLQTAPAMLKARAIDSSSGIVWPCLHAAGKSLGRRET